MNIVSKRILQDLFKSTEGLYIYTLYQRFKVPPKDLFVAIKSLVEQNFIIEEEDRLTLTPEGKDFIIQTDITVKSNGGKYAKIPLHFLGRRIEINEFYLPTSLNTQSELLT